MRIPDFYDEVVSVAMIINLNAYRKEKKAAYEREMLKQFSLELLGRQFRHLADGLKGLPHYSIEPAEEHCYDIAVEAFLLGAAYSRYSRYGEDAEEIKKRSYSELSMLTNVLFSYLSQPVDEAPRHIEDSLYQLADEYVMVWWKEGYVKGINRAKQRFR